MEKNFIRYIIIFFISVIFTLYLFEFYLLQKKKNFSSFIQERIKIKETEIKKFDRRSVLEVFNSLKDKENVTAKFLPTLFLNEKNNNLFPLSGVSSIKTIFCNENGYMSYYFSDRYGFNNPDNEWKQIEDNKRDEGGGININPHSLKKNQKDYNWDVEYVLLGDSFTHGACVNRPNDIGSVLRNLSKKTVLNLGYVGNGPLIEYATFREYVNFNARNVLFFYTEQGDLENLNLELKNEVLINYLSKKEFSQNLKGKQKEINSLVKLNIQKSFNAEEDLLYHQEKFKKKKNKFLKFLRLNDTKDLLKNNFSYFNLNKQLPLNEFKFIINDLNERTKLLGGNFYFVYLPGPQKHLSNSMLYQNKIYERKKIIFSFLNNQNIKSIDIDDEVFKNLKDPLTLYSTKIDHYNEKGYELVAKAVYRKTKFNRVN